MPLLNFFSGLRRWRGSPEDRPGLKRKAFDRTQILKLPLKFTGRIAVLASGFRLEPNMREFDPEDIQGLAGFGPESLVAPLDTSLSLADRKLRGLVDLPSLRFALVVLTRVDDEPLEDHHRDLLWRAFGVPVFEQFRDADGTVIARECEVHDGLHISENANTPDTPCEVITSHCECGAETPRLRMLARPRRVAAAA